MCSTSAGRGHAQRQLRQQQQRQHPPKSRRHRSSSRRLPLVRRTQRPSRPGSSLPPSDQAPRRQRPPAAPLAAGPGARARRGPSDTHPWPRLTLKIERNMERRRSCMQLDRSRPRDDHELDRPRVHAWGCRLWHIRDHDVYVLAYIGRIRIRRYLKFKFKFRPEIIVNRGL